MDPRLGEDELCLTMWAQQKISKGKIDQIVGGKSQRIASRLLYMLLRDAWPTMTRVVVELELALEQQG